MNDYGPGRNASIELSLRRTLVGSVILIGNCISSYCNEAHIMLNKVLTAAVSDPPAKVLYGGQAQQKLIVALKPAN